MSSSQSSAEVMAQNNDAEEELQLDIEDVAESFENDPDQHMSSDEDEDEDAVSSSALEGEAPDNGEMGNMEEDFVDESIQGFFEHKDSVYALAVTPANLDLCASGGGDEIAYLWSIGSGDKLATLDGHTDSITSLQFSHDGLYLVSAGMDGLVRVWKLGSGERPTCDLVTVLEAGSEVMWVHFHPKGYVLIAGTADSTVWMWNLPKGNVMGVFAGHTASSTSGCWASDGKSFASVSEDGTIIQWDPLTGQAGKRWETSQDERLSGGDTGWNVIALDSTGKICIVGSPEGKAKVINLATGALLASLETQTDSIEAIVYSSTLPLVAIASIDGSIALYEVPSMKMRGVLRHEDAVVALHFEPGTPFLFSCSTDMTVRKWDVRTSKEEQRWRGHQDAILCMAVIKGGKKVITAGDDKTALVFGNA